MALTLEYACYPSAEEPVTCHAGVPWKQCAWVAIIIKYQALSIWATLVDHFDWPTHGFAKIYLLATGLINTALMSIVVLCTIGKAMVRSNMQQGMFSFTDATHCNRLQHTVLFIIQL